MTSVLSPRAALSVDQRQAMHTAATRMCRDYADTFSIETIEEFLYSSYDTLALGAAITNYLPLLAERFARQRLTALATVEGHPRDEKPIVLFVCTHNTARSQMAMGLFTALAGDRAVAWSAGSMPGRVVDSEAVTAMAAHDIDISGEYPKPWTEEIIRAADVVVTMGCGDACPVLPGPRYQNWKIDDPAGCAPSRVDCIFDNLDDRIRDLLTELNIEPQLPAGAATS
ncbi:Arsenate-mycothiol transferase ArsC1 [Mycobacterium sp. smrl_JER01]